jgi:hypothetical protein
VSSATETAIQALIAALTAQASGGSPPFPVPTRNNTLPSRFVEWGNAGLTAFFNVLDGNGRVTQETLGLPDVQPDTYEIHHRVEIEWVVQGTNSAAREAAFDVGLVGINAALAVDRTLGDVVSWSQVDETVRSNLVTETLPNTKAIVVYVRMEFLSDMPF